MSEAIPTPKKIWIITGETQTPKITSVKDSATRGGSRDTGGILGG